MAAVTVRTRGAPAVIVRPASGPAVAAVTVPGQQGGVGATGATGASAYEVWRAAGNTGSPGDFLASLKGDPGQDLGFGQLRVADMKVDPEDYFSANLRQQLIFTPDPTQTQNYLRDPFKGVMWSGNKLVARPNSIGDWQDIIVNLLVVPQFAGGSIVADLDVGTGTPVQTADYGLRGSGAAERATFRLGTQTLAGFQNNGGKIFLTGTVPFVVQSEAIVYLPISTGPGQ